MLSPRSKVPHGPPVARMTFDRSRIKNRGPTDRPLYRMARMLECFVMNSLRARSPANDCEKAPQSAVIVGPLGPAGDESLTVATRSELGECCHSGANTA
jgi:hypothetical protein